MERDVAQAQPARDEALLGGDPCIVERSDS